VDWNSATSEAFEQPLCDVSAVAVSLQAMPAPASEVLDDGELLPTTPGFYGWWSRRDAIAGLPHVAHPLQGELSLLYIGISPVRESVAAEDSVARHRQPSEGQRRLVDVPLHARRAADRCPYPAPYMRQTKVALDAADNARLSEWQREHLLLTWCPRQRPWEIEREVIAELGPPLNSAGNAAHAFYARVHAARAEFRRRAAHERRAPTAPARSS
jgi:hypothetical protein